MKLMKQMKQGIVAILCIAMLFGLCNVPALVAQAATKPTLGDTKLTISLGKQEYSNISVYNTVKGATYSYISSDKKIVTVSKKGVLTGVKAGKAKITVNQTYKGKKTKVGTCSIVVKASSLMDKEYSINYRRGPMSEYDTYDYNLNYWWLIDYKPTGAKYTFTSSDSKILKIDKDGLITEMNEPGKSVTITVKETFNKKTRTVGKFKMTIRIPALNIEELEVGINEYFYPYDYFTGYSGNYYVVCSSDADPNTDNSNVVDVKDDYDTSNDTLGFVREDGYWTGALKAQKEGTAYVHCYAASTSDEISKDTYFGTIKVVVKEMKATELSWDLEDTYGREENGVLTYEYDEYDEYDYSFSLYYTYAPYNCTDVPVITSSDPKVATVEDSYMGNVLLAIKGEGTTTITVKLGDYTITKQVKFVKAMD